MKSIKSVVIENFQSHEHTEIEPAPSGGLTVIVGPSGHGKTAVLRALRWLLYNQPQGTGFMRKGAKMVRVTSEIDGGGTAIRERTTATNRYTAITAEAGRQVFKGSGTDVPLEIQQLTGVRPVRIADLTLTPNLARQLDGPFLGEEAVSAGTRAKVLGRIAGVDEVDHASKTLATDQFRRGQEEKRLERDLEDLDRQIAGYAHLPELARRIDSLGRIVTAIRAAQERRTALVGLRDRLVQVRAARQVTETTLERWQFLLHAETALATTAAGVERRTQLDGFRTRWQSVQTGLTEAMDKLAALMYVPALGTRVEHLTADVTLRQGLGVLRNRLQIVSSALSAEQGKVAALAGVPAALEILASVQVATIGRQTLGNLHGRIQDVGTALRFEQAKASTLEGVPRALTALTSAEKAATRRTQVVQLRGKLATARDSVRFAGMTLARYDQANDALEVLARAAAAAELRVKATDLAGQLVEIRKGVKTAEAQTVWWADQGRAAQEEYMDALIAAGKCPVCGSKIHPEHLKEVV